MAKAKLNAKSKTKDNGNDNEKEKAEQVAKGDTFPEVDSLKTLTPKERLRIKELIDEDLELATAEKQVKYGRASVKAEMEPFLKRLKIAEGSGIRNGRRAAYFNGYKRSKTLSRELLVENGVKVSTILKSYAESEPWLDLKISDLDQKDAKQAARREAKEKAKGQ